MSDLLKELRPEGSWHAKLVAEGIHNEGFWRVQLTEAVLWLFSGDPTNKDK